MRNEDRLNLSHAIHSRACCSIKPPSISASASGGCVPGPTLQFRQPRERPTATDPGIVPAMRTGSGLSRPPYSRPLATSAIKIQALFPSRRRRRVSTFEGPRPLLLSRLPSNFRFRLSSMLALPGAAATPPDPGWSCSC